MALETDLAGIHRLFDDVAERSDAAVAKHQRLMDQLVRFRTHVDQTAGKADGDGTKDDPVATIEEALALTPLGARAEIRIRGDYTTTRFYHADGRHVAILGCDAGFEPVTAPADYPALRFGVIEGEINQPVAATPVRRLANFNVAYGSYYDFWRWKIAMPSTADVAAALPDLPDSSRTRHKALFTRGSSGSGRLGGAMLRNCDLHIPETPYGPIMGNGAGYVLQVSILSLSGQARLDGHVLPGVAGGTQAHTMAHRLTTTLKTL